MFVKMLIISLTPYHVNVDVFLNLCVCVCADNTELNMLTFSSNLIIFISHASQEHIVIDDEHTQWVTIFAERPRYPPALLVPRQQILWYPTVLQLHPIQISFRGSRLGFASLRMTHFSQIYFTQLIAL